MVRLVLGDLHSELTAHNLSCVAAVYESARATPWLCRLHALLSFGGSTAQPPMITPLATMLTEGDFIWAGLVYGEREGSKTVGLVETFHVSELDRLVERLLELREACREAG
jgi:hypothetical protein